MPPRKSDPARRSDTTTASFVLVEDVEAAEALPLHASSSTRLPTAAAAASTPAAMMEADRPSESAPPTDKEKRESRDSVTIEDLTLPKSIITRLAKGVLPPNTQIQTNAVLAMSKSATVFINHLANAANEHTQNANKKTIMPNDVFAALEDIEFPFLRERLEAEFKKFNEVQTTKRNTYRRKVAAAKAGKSASSATATSADAAAPGPNVSTVSAAASEPSAVPRSAKKQKTNGPDDSRMDIDGGANDEERDASDPETEPEQEHDDDEDDDGLEEEEEEDDDDEDEDRNGHEMREDALEERDAKDNDRDEALDDGDSD
ncbi:hypothetical protein DL765_003660 [Monosporascus sp. GIB2]|nr:hypothetical protein DL765_003660 [Monosporascus sp. GIB2]